MKRPAFQFYPADWRSNAKLRRCSEAARGAWMDVLCLLHDSDEYGVIRWPLADIARAAGVPLKLLKELSEKQVLKGGDKGCDAYCFTPRHAGRDGEPVELLSESNSACWYCSRFIRDEYIRMKRGGSSQFTSENQPPKDKPKQTPKPPFGDGPSSASSSSSSASLRTPISPPLQSSPSLADFDEAPPLPPRGNGEELFEKSDKNPTTPQALRIASLFNRRSSTAWSAKEIRAFKAMGKVDPEDLELVCRYTENERRKGNDGRHRRDLLTFLNNFPGELDRARAKTPNGNASKTTTADSYGI